MAEGSPLKRIKGFNKEFRGLEVALIKKFVCIFDIFETVRHPISIAWKRKMLKIWFKGAKKELRWFKVAFKLIIFPPDQYKPILFYSKFYAVNFPVLDMPQTPVAN